MKNYGQIEIYEVLLKYVLHFSILRSGQKYLYSIYKGINHFCFEYKSFGTIH